MALGTIKWFDATKGFGFIEPNEGGNDVLVHISAVRRSGLHSLNKGQQVSFDPEKSLEGKMMAVNLKLSRPF